MRWRSSERRIGVAALALVVAVAACVTTTERYWVPTAGDPRLDQNEIRQAADRFAGVQCERLLGGAPSATGAATLKLTVAPDGEVREARIERSSGDEQMDGIFGALAARLVLPPAGAPRDDWTARVRMGYSCAPDAAVTTFEVL